MSKIGRKPIQLNDVQVEIKGQSVIYKGKSGSGTYILPDELTALVKGKELFIKPSERGARSSSINRIWGLHRALLNNRIQGAHAPFERQLNIVGLGFKATVTGKKVDFALGFSHKIHFNLPDNVTMETDKTGQQLTLKSSDKELLGQVCSTIKSFRKVEPYKGTGIEFKGQAIRRKAGKSSKAA